MSSHILPFRWYKEVLNILCQCSKRRQVDQSQNKPGSSLLNCVNALMTSHLQDITKESINDFTDLIVPPSVSDSTLCIMRKFWDI